MKKVEEKKEKAMRTRSVILVFTALVLSVVGCNQAQPKVSQEDLANAVTKTLPTYFPLVPGSWWEYTVTHPGDDSLTYEEVHWPMSTDGGGVVMASRGRQRPEWNSGVNASNLRVILKVVKVASQQGPFQYPIGYAIEYTRNDLESFRPPKGFYLNGLSDTQSGYRVFLVRTYDQFSPEAPGMVIGDGYSTQILFFCRGDYLLSAMDPTYINSGKVLVVMSLGSSDSPTEALEFRGIDTKVSGYDGKPLLHFRRTVAEANKVAESVLDSAFTEDTYFASGLGMVRLVQTINGSVSMTWDLAGYHTS